MVEGCPVGTTPVVWSAILCYVHLVLFRCVGGCGGRVFGVCMCGRDVVFGVGGCGGRVFGVL